MIYPRIGIYSVSKAKMKIEILGNPKPLKRHRTSRGKVYDPSFEDKTNFAWDVRTLTVGLFPHTESIKVEFEYHMPIPKSYSKKARLKAVGEPHQKKPDISNLIKFTEDALNEILWEDDSVIAEIKAKKIYSEEPKTISTVKKLR